MWLCCRRTDQINRVIQVFKVRKCELLIDNDLRIKVLSVPAFACYHWRKYSATTTTTAPPPREKTQTRGKIKTWRLVWLSSFSQSLAPGPRDLIQKSTTINFVVWKNTDYKLISRPTDRVFNVYWFTAYRNISISAYLLYFDDYNCRQKSSFIDP